MGREEHSKHISLVCVGSARSVWTTVDLPQLMAACAFLVYTAQVSGCSAGALSKAHAVFCALPRSELLKFRFSGTSQEHRLGWACVLCPSQVRAAHQVRGAPTVPGGSCILIISPVPAAREHHLRCAVCLLWGADLRLRPSWRMSTIQEPRKTWLATGSLLSVWWRMLVSGAEVGVAPCLPALAVTHLPLCLLRQGRSLYAADQLSFGIHSILCSLRGPGCALD